MVITKSAEDDLRRLPVAIRERILSKLTFYDASSDPLVFAERIHGHAMGTYRFRIGDYRALFDVLRSEIYILAVGHRKEIYK